MRGTSLTLLALCLSTLGVPATWAQSAPQIKRLDAPRFDLAVGYNNTRANAPPGVCNCFDMNGGFLEFGTHLTNRFSIAGEFTGNHAGSIGPLGQDLTLTTFTVGPRVSYTKNRFTLFGEALVGGAHGGDSYFPSSTSVSSSATSFAFSPGGSLDIKLDSHFALRALNVKYLRTSFPNGVNNEQNQLMIGAGLVYKFNGHSPKVAPPVAAPPPTPPPSTVVFMCGTNVANVPLGQMVVISGEARTEPANLGVDYSWSSNGGSIEGSGKVVSINTTGMAVGDYRVTGHASLTSDAQTSSECTAVFRVIPVEPPPAPSIAYVPVSDPAADQKVFHENVQDAFFAVNSAKITPESQVSIDRAAKYLIAHPAIHVIINGWADSRGSVQYNLSLGMRRANSVRSALIAAGVPGDQLEVITNGKSSQVCTNSDQNCWRLNRRASFMMRP